LAGGAGFLGAGHVPKGKGRTDDLFAMDAHAVAGSLAGVEHLVHGVDKRRDVGLARAGASMADPGVDVGLARLEHG